MLARLVFLAERHAPDPHQTLYLCTQMMVPTLCLGPLPLVRTARTLAVWGKIVNVPSFGVLIWCWFLTSISDPGRDALPPAQWKIPRPTPSGDIY